MTAPLSDATELAFADIDTALGRIADGLRGGAMIPYLGPGVLDLAQEAVLPPSTPEALAEFLGTKVALPKRARGNVWAAAQYIEAHRHRSTVTTLMSEAFAPSVPPTPLHIWLASLGPSLIVDAWYDGAMRDALGAYCNDWGEVQGITRATLNEDGWYAFYDADGAPADAVSSAERKTLLYKPHGAVTPAKNFLISDADYVEVLTEIDIQTPIPPEVRNRRADRSFVFFGCRFHDQMLRTYARQISKRSSGPHYAVVDPEELTRNEIRFLSAQGFELVPLSLREAVEQLTA